MAGRRTAISMGSVALARADGEGLRTRAHVPLDPALAVGVLAALGMGVLAAYSAALAAVPALVLLAGLAVVRFGRMGLLQLLLACLPWMLVFDSLLPPLTRTFTTAAAAIALLAVVAPLRFNDWPVPVGAALFSAIVVGRATVAESGDELVEAAKLLIFPAVALAVTSSRGRELLPQTRTLVLASSLAALAVHLGVLAAGLGDVGTKYGIGEKFGFTREIYHEFPLFGVIVAAAGMASTRRISVQVAFFSLGVVPAALSGVRSGVVAALFVLIVFIWRSRLSLRTVALVGCVIVMAVASGATSTISARLDRESGEFSSIDRVGSGRGLIWRVAIKHWADSGPLGWLLGTGLNTVDRFELEDIGFALIGHSDVITVGVQLGILGLLAWLLIWLGLIRAQLRGLVLLPIGIFAVINGASEYVAPLTVGLVLAAALSARPEEAGVPRSRAEPGPRVAALPPRQVSRA